jgi:hypothetical protein
MEVAATEVAAPVEVATDATQTAPVESPKYKVTIDGKETEVTLDELQRGYSHASAANQQLRQAAEDRKQAKALLQTLKENPRQILKNLPGFNEDDFVNSILDEKIRRELEDARMASLSPEQREALELKERVAKYEAQEAEREKALKSEKFQQIADQYREEVMGEILTSLEGQNVPQKYVPHLIKEIAQHKANTLKQGYNGKDKQAIPIAVIAKKVLEDFHETQKGLFSQADPDHLIKILGKEGIAKLIKSQLEANNPVVKSAPVVIQRKSERDKLVPQRRTFADFHNKRRN